MALITRNELKTIGLRRSQQDLIDLLPRVHELLDLLDENGLLPAEEPAAPVVHPDELVDEPTAGKPAPDKTASK